MDGDMCSSLADFAKENPVRKPGLKCWACSIPEAEEINQGRRSGTAISVIRDWLVQRQGYSEDVATLNKLTHHFSNNRHHERGR